MYAHLSIVEKKTIQKGLLFKFFKRSSSIHNNPALVASLVLKKSTSMVFVRFLKKKGNSGVLVRSLKKPNFTR